MLKNLNESIQNRNFVDGVDFTAEDPCIFVLFPPGAGGDLLTSIIDKHYLRTGCEYYGIDDTGRVHFISSDFKMIDFSANDYDGRFTVQMQHLNEDVVTTRPTSQTDTQTFEFNQEFFWKLAESLGKRQMNYSLIDQMIFACHQCFDHQVQCILDTFPQAQIIRLTPRDSTGTQIIFDQITHKVNPEAIIKETPSYYQFKHDRVLELAFGTMFNEQSYYETYSKVIDFLNLKGRLIHWDYVQYYLSKQKPGMAQRLIDYSKTINV